MSDIPDLSLAQRRLFIITLALFLSYLAVAMALPVVPVYVTRDLGMSNAAGGLAVGIAFFSTILTRNLAGGLADRRGSRFAMLRGLMTYVAACLLCLASALPGLHGALAYGLLLAGRLLLGLGESLVIVATISWGIGLMGPARSGKVMALVGAAMYGAFAVGGPLGLALLHATGFSGLMAACAALPLLGACMVRGVAEVQPQAGRRESFWRILGRIWLPGAAVCLQGVGFAALAAFISLYFLSRGWPHAGLGLTCFGGGFVAVRLLFGHLPDKIGGTPVAIVSLIVEAAGQYLLWLAPGPGTALVGALLTGFGCSMVFPAMGSEVVKSMPPQLRGTAVGGFAAFQDLAYGATGPVTGLLADHFGYGVVFLIGGIAATLGLLAAVMTHRVTASRRLGPAGAGR
jgi:MFS family permease